MSTEHEVDLSNATPALRPFRMDDAQSLYEAVARVDGRTGTMAFLVPRGLHDQRQHPILESCGEAHRKETEFGIAVFERGTDRLVGGCGINQIEKAALAQISVTGCEPVPPDADTLVRPRSWPHAGRSRAWASSASKSLPPRAITPANASRSACATLEGIARRRCSAWGAARRVRFFGRS